MKLFRRMTQIPSSLLHWWWSMWKVCQAWSLFLSCARKYHQDPCNLTCVKKLLTNPTAATTIVMQNFLESEWLICSYDNWTLKMRRTSECGMQGRVQWLFTLCADSRPSSTPRGQWYCLEMSSRKLGIQGKFSCIVYTSESVDNLLEKQFYFGNVLSLNCLWSL